MSKRDDMTETAVALLRNALENNYKFILAVEDDKKARVDITNITNPILCARFLERVARDRRASA